MHFHTRALELRRQLGDEIGVVMSLNALGRADRALALARSGLEIAEDLDHTVRKGFALLELGRIHAQLDTPEEALDCFHQAAGLHRSICDHVREAESFEGAGETYRSLGRPDEAIRFYRQAASGYRRNKARWNLALCLNNLATVVSQNYTPEPAQAHWREALEALRDFTDPQAVRLREEITARLPTRTPPETRSVATGPSLRRTR